MTSQRNVSSYTAQQYDAAVQKRNDGFRKTTEELGEQLKLDSGKRRALQAALAADEGAIYPSAPLLKWLYGCVCHILMPKRLC